MGNRTPYAETELLLAVMEQDWDEADRLVRDMLPGECAQMQNALIDLNVILRHGFVPKSYPQKDSK